MLKEIKANLSRSIPLELVDGLIHYYSEMKEKFYLGRHENTELNAGKFSEMVFRILEHVTSGTYTGLGKEIQKFADCCRAFQNLASASFDDSIRMHIPRALIMIVDIRNKRDVGHVSGIHSPNLMDSVFVVHSADWILAELIRLYHGCTTDEAQQIVDRIIERKLPTVAAVGGKKRVLKSGLPFKDQVLLLLYEAHPKSIPVKTLFDWVEHSHSSNFIRVVIKPLHKERKIEFQNQECVILPPGIKHVEESGLITG